VLYVTNISVVPEYPRHWQPVPLLKNPVMPILPSWSIDLFFRQKQSGGGSVGADENQATPGAVLPNMAPSTQQQPEATKGHQSTGIRQHLL